MSPVIVDIYSSLFTCRAHLLGLVFSGYQQLPNREASVIDHVCLIVQDLSSGCQLPNTTEAICDRPCLFIVVSLVAVSYQTQQTMSV
jgi:hypothetical protein